MRLIADGRKRRLLHPLEVHRLRLHLVAVCHVHHPHGDREPQLPQPSHQLHPRPGPADQVDLCLPRCRRGDRQPREQRHIGPSRRGMPPHLHIRTVGRANPLLRHHLRRRPRREYSPPRQHHQVIAVLARQVEIVHHHHRRQPPLRGQTACQVQDLDLVVDIEMSRRFIQQQHIRPLRQRAGDHAPLPLAPRQRRDRPIRQHRCVRKLHTLPRDLVIPRPFDPEARQVWRSAHQHHFPHRELEVHRVILRDHRQPPRHRIRPHLIDVDPVQQHPPIQRRQHPAQRPHQRRLPRPVRPHHAHEPAPLRAQTHLSQHRLLGVPNCQRQSL